MPLALAYSAAEAVIAGLYGGHVPVVPMTKVREPPPGTAPHEPGIERFREIIAKRLRQASAAERGVLAGDEVRDELIRLSGGQPGELMVMVRESLVRGDLPITAAAVELAAGVRRRAYTRQLLAEHWPIIDEVRKTGRLIRSRENDQAIRELLDSRAILHYVSEDDWYAVNPVIAEVQGPS